MISPYSGPSDLPPVLPIFPLSGSILLPRASLTLNVFEPRYLELVDHALAHERLMGIVQPAGDTGASESPQGKSFPVRSVACAGRIVSFNETDEGPLVISLIGISRYRLGDEADSGALFRMFDADFTPYADDFIRDLGEDEVDRVGLLETLRRYLEANGLNADWERINEAPNEQLVNTLSILSPYGAEEKQALLEATSLQERADALVALAEMELAARDDNSGTSLQ
ncbi:MAG: LON peptidase substrate-binding domain-containing protein [Pseudomonadota bacterium]